jgi:hypothetical protein
MPTGEAISFRQSRDVGDLITATFAYLRQNWRSLGKGLLYIMGPVLVVQLVVSSLYQRQMFGMMSMGGGGDPVTPGEVEALYSEMIVPMLLMLPVSLLVGMLAVTVVYEHMRLYQQRGPDAASVADVWAGVKRSFWKTAGTALVAMLAWIVACVVVVMSGGLVMTVLGAGVGPVGAGLGALLMLGGFVCVGAYFMVMVALLFPVRMYEDVGLGEAFGRVRELLKGAFWRSLGVVFVVALLAYVMTMAFSMPATILGAVWGFNSLGGAGGGGGALFQVALVAANTVGAVGATATYCIPLVAAGLYYFGRVEDREHPGLAARVEQVGGVEREGVGERERGSVGREHAKRGGGNGVGSKGDALSEEHATGSRTSSDEDEDQTRWRPPAGGKRDAS